MGSVGLESAWCSGVYSWFRKSYRGKELLDLGGIVVSDLHLYHYCLQDHRKDDRIPLVRELEMKHCSIMR